MRPVFLFFLLAFSYFLSAQNLVPFKSSSGFWGYKDADFDEIVIAPKYNSADNFSEGLAMVSDFSVNKLFRYGFIDAKGNLVIALKYQKAGRFAEGLAPVRTERGKISFIDKSGNEVLKTDYDDARPFSNGLAAVISGNKTGFINPQGKIIVPLIYEAANDFLDECTLAMIDNTTVQIDSSGQELPLITEYGYADRNQKKIVISPTSFNTGRGFTADGLAIVSTFKNGLSGAINKSGNFIIPLKYNRIKRLNNGLYCVTERNTCGVMNKRGTLLVPPRYKSMHSSTDKLAVAVTNANEFIFIDKEGRETTPPLTDYYNWKGTLCEVRIKKLSGVINQDGKLVVPIKFERIEITEGGSVIVWMNNKCGLYSHEGKPLTDLIYSQIYDYKDGLIKVQVDKNYLGYLYGFLDRSGKEVVPPVYSEATNFEEGVAIIKKEGKWGAVDRKGKFIIPLKFSMMYPFNEGLSVVSVDQKWGFVDPAGKTRIPFAFSMAASFNKGMAPVKQGSKYGYINPKGQFVFTMRFDNARPFADDYAAVQLNNKWGLINRKGVLVIQPMYNDIMDVDNGTVRVNLDGKWGVAAVDGRYLVRPIYDEIDILSENRLAVRQGKEWGYVNLKGEVVVKPAYKAAKKFSEGLAAVSYSDMGGLFFIDTAGKRVLDGPYLFTGSFKNGKVFVVRQNRSEVYINKKGQEVNNFTINTQGEDIFVAFKSPGGNSPAGSGNTSSPKPSPSEKRLTQSFTKKYSYSKTAGYEDYMPAAYKVEVTRDLIRVLIGGANGLYATWAEYRIIGSDQFRESGQMQGPVYLADNKKLLFFFSDGGRDFLRIASTENGAYTEYVSDRF
jgi:hypothetical protein